jgi:uncharacterized protein (DUF39 family)
MTAEEIVGCVERKGLGAAARGVDVATTATFGSIGNWRHPSRLQMADAASRYC